MDACSIEKFDDLTLDWALHPADVSAFFENYYEQQPLLIPRGESGYYSRLFSIEAVDRLSFDLDRDEFRFAKDGETTPTGRLRYFNRLADTDAIFAEFRSGSTLILEGMHRRWPPLSLFCRDLERVFGFDVQANVYLTPHHSQGFKPHFDTHDVLVLQVEGSKYWKIYDSPICLPLKSQQIRKDERPPDPGRPTLEFDLRAGDCVYIPRGYIHEGAASDEASLHISVGLLAYTWSDALADMVASLSLEDADLRRSILLPEEADAEARTPLATRFHQLLERLRASEKIDEVLIAARKRFCLNRRPLLHGQLRSLLDSERIHSGTPVTRRPGILFRIRVEGEEIGISFHGKEVVFPRIAAAELYWILEREGPFSIGEIEGYCDDEGRRTLVRRLIQEGFLEIVQLRNPERLPEAAPDAGSLAL